MFDKSLLDSLNIYFKTLSVLGYMNYNNVNKLIVLIFIQEMLKGLFSNVLSEADLQTIQRVVSNIYGRACLLPFPQIDRQSDLRYRFGSNIFRVSEDDILRVTEDYYHRVTEK